MRAFILGRIPGGLHDLLSTFLVETLALIEEGYVVRAFLNMGMSLLVCLLACC